MPKTAIVIGGGIIGLSSAYYLQQAGWQVTVSADPAIDIVVDRGRIGASTSLVDGQASHSVAVP